MLPFANREAMNLHPREISQCVSEGAHALLVVDGAGWHTSAKLQVPDNITLLILPPYAPELNPVENIWQYLRQNKLAIRLFQTYKDIVEAHATGAYSYQQLVSWNNRRRIPTNAVAT